MSSILKQDIKYIYLEQSFFCRCALDKMNYFSDQYEQNCLYEYIKNYAKENFLGSYKYIVVYLKGHNTTLVRELNYAYVYRKQHDLPLPTILGPYYEKRNLQLFSEFLIQDYFVNLESNCANILSHIANPIPQYVHNICFKYLSNNIFAKNIIILPNIQ